MIHCTAKNPLTWSILLNKKLTYSPKINRFNCWCSHGLKVIIIFLKNENLIRSTLNSNTQRSSTEWSWGVSALCSIYSLAITSSWSSQTPSPKVRDRPLILRIWLIILQSCAKSLIKYPGIYGQRFQITLKYITAQFKSISFLLFYLRIVGSCLGCEI